MFKNKKIKLLCPLMSTVVLSSAVATSIGCSYKNTTVREIEIPKDIDCDLTIVKNNQEGIEVIVKVKHPETKRIDSIKVKIGETELKDTEYSFDKSSGKLTISKDVLSAKPDKSVTITPTIIDIEKTVKKIEVNTASITKNVGETIDSTDVNVTITYEDDSKKENAQYGEDYKVYTTLQTGEIEVKLPYIVERAFSGHNILCKIRSLKPTQGQTVETDFTVKVNTTAKIAKLEYEELGFKDNGININDAECKKTFNITQPETGSSTIKIENYKSTKATQGIVKIWDKTKQRYILTSNHLNIKNGSGTIEINFNSWDKLEETTFEHELVVRFFRGEFNGQHWSDVLSAIEKFEEKDQPEIQDATTLCKALGVITPLEHNDAQSTLQVNLVGLEGTIFINNKMYTIRCIDAMHDKIVNSEGTVTTKAAALTFELVTLLSRENGTAITSYWDVENNYNYTNSILRANLTGQGKGEKTFDSTALSMLPQELQDGIKTVNKKVATFNSESQKYEVKDEGYNDKLFPLTYTEMDQSGSSKAKVEGSPYKYWTNHNTRDDRVKYDTKGNSYDYWLASPNTNNSNDIVWGVGTSGGVYDYCYVRYTFGVSFAFCI